MIKKLFSILFSLALSNSIYAQKTNDTEFKEKSNPIIYVEAIGGVSCMDHFGFAGGGELNYQNNKNLFSFRYSHLMGLKKNDQVFSFYNVEDNDEYAVLYGKRWVKRSISFSVSAGVSYNHLKVVASDFEDNFYNQYQRYYGMPFECNFKFFYPKKRSKLIYNCIIPSIGVKLFGSISKNSFVGVGFALGFGLSKDYK